MRLSDKLIASVVATVILGSCETGNIELYTPKDNVIISNNMPLLTWKEVKCAEYQVIIDGIKMAELPSSHNYYSAFPLSFGKHSWQIRCIEDKDTVNSKEAFFTVSDKPLADLPEKSQLLRYDWKVISSLVAGKNGQDMSQAGVNTESWAKTTLPSTVLTALVRNGIYPDPYVDMNNMLIPDLNDEYNDENSLLEYSHIKGVNPWKDFYWYRTEFNLSPDLSGKQIWLNFSELNYKAQIWLNGVEIADSSSVVGMERHFKFDVTSLINKEGINTLAVGIYPPDPSGKPAPDPIAPLSDPGCNMGDGMISHNYTKWDTMGWDWQPPVRDRDMGITEDVYLSSTDDLELCDLYISSDMALPDTTTADLTLSANLINHSNREIQGIIDVVIRNGQDSVVFSEPYSIKANTTKSVLFDKMVNEKMHIVSPKLWWPYGYGSQNLYSVKMSAKEKGIPVSTIKDTFGIRKVETYIGSDERIYKINGRRIYPRGGNWVIDMMLNWNASRYEKEILLTRNANLNILRIWGPTGIAPKPLYRAADKYGVLIWQDFLNDYWGTFKNTPGYQPEKNLYRTITEDIVKKYRNHPSLIIWCGGNEGVNPREDMIVNDILSLYDNRDSRHYLKRSDGDGLHGGGPYHTLEPKEYFNHPKLHGFSSEIGPSGIPVEESIKKFFKHKIHPWYPGRFPVDGYWAFHDANDWPGDDTRKFTAYDNMLRTFYGDVDSTNVEKGFTEYIKKAQIINYDVYRASIESINKKLWDKASGILLWKSNSSWPSMTWQIYDWYLQAHAGYYGTKKAASPIHLQWNRDDNSISVVNHTYNSLQNVVLKIEEYDLTDNNKTESKIYISVPADTSIVISKKMAVSDKTQFVRLLLEENAGNVIADNLYWLNASDDYSLLKELKETDLHVESALTLEDITKKYYTVHIENKGKSSAFMVSLKIVGENSGMEILPSFWSDNYVTLLPGEKRCVDVALFKEDISDNPKIEYESYNSYKKWSIIK